jgi:hypothetical protein
MFLTRPPPGRTPSGTTARQWWSWRAISHWQTRRSWDGGRAQRGSRWWRSAPPRGQVRSAREWSARHDHCPGVRVQALVAFVAIVVSAWPAPTKAQGAATATPLPTSTLVRLERDTLDQVVADFLNPCWAVSTYLTDTGLNPAAPHPYIQLLHDHAWDLLAAMLGYLALTPQAAQLPVELRALMRAQVQGRGGYYQDTQAQEAAQALDRAVARWQAADWGAQDVDRDGLAIVALVMSDPDRAALYREAVEHAWRPLALRRFTLRGTVERPVCPLGRSFEEILAEQDRRRRERDQQQYRECLEEERRNPSIIQCPRRPFP